MNPNAPLWIINNMTQLNTMQNSNQAILNDQLLNPWLLIISVTAIIILITILLIYVYIIHR